MNNVKIPPNDHFNCWTSLIKASVVFAICFQAQAHTNGEMVVQYILHAYWEYRDGRKRRYSVKYWQIIIIRAICETKTENYKFYT